LEFDHYLKDLLNGETFQGREEGFKVTSPHPCFFLEGDDSNSFFILELPNSVLVSSFVGKVMKEFIVVIPIFYL